MTAPVPTWKFWHPLPFWQVIAVGFVLQFIFVVPLAMLEGGMHLGIPVWIGNGIAGGLMYPSVRYLAQRRQVAGA
jgi:hypothetical protein